MSNISKFNYETIERSYDSNLNRSEVEVVDGEKEGSVEKKDNNLSNSIVKSGKDLDNIWLETWIKSRNYSPKIQGFLIDGKLGYVEFMRAYLGLTYTNIITFANDDVTPSVANGNIFKTAIGHTAAKDITAFDNANVGQQIIIIGADNTNKTTVKDGALLKINGDWLEEAEATLTLVWDGTNWYELARRHS